jgi:hypothetical protein
MLCDFLPEPVMGGLVDQGLDLRCFGKLELKNTKNP